MSYAVIDWETSTKTSYGRKANPFDKSNYVVAWGIKKRGEQAKTYYKEDPPKHWLKDVKILIAHNAKFDLTWIWKQPVIIDFLKGGGKIWCTQYAEYLLTGQQAQWNSLNDVSAKYGGSQKNDEIKAMWDQGIETEDIPKDMLLDYLVDDLDNTEIVYLKQIKRAKELGMINSILSHMEGLLCMTEMEYNGLYIDQKLGNKQAKELEIKLEKVVGKLEEYIPKDLPPEVTWNWGSKDHLSALFFGGGIKYKRSVPKLDEEGNPTFTKKKEAWYLLDGEPVDPKKCKDTTKLERYKSGAKAGKLKTKNVAVQGDPKTIIETFEHEIEGLYSPNPKWQTKKLGVYKTDADVLLVLKEADVEAAELMLEWRKIDKDLGTYYKRYDPKKKKDVGMLTLVQPDGLIHHGLNNVATVTGRLSSSSPNLQNIPRKDKSEVKGLFISRFDDGYMIESDFSQLEVVVQGMLSGDPTLIKDINEGVDFHVKRLSAKLGEAYEDIFRKAKVEKIKEYVDGRQDSKEYSFQRAYGASAYAIAESTGMRLEDVKAFIQAEETMYPGVVSFNDEMMKFIKDSRRITSKKAFVDGVVCPIGVGWFGTPTGKRYVFTEKVTPEFMRQKKTWQKNWTPTYVSFSPTEVKNYAVQGLAGEIVIMCLGYLFRKFLETDNFGGKAFLINTVHDCVWVDADASVVKEVAQIVEDTLKSAKELIEERYNIKCPVRFRAETEVGRNMLDMTELHELAA